MGFALVQSRAAHLCARLQPLVHLVDPVLGLDHVGRVSPVERSERRGVERVVGWVGHGAEAAAAAAAGAPGEARGAISTSSGHGGAHGSAMLSEGPPRSEAAAVEAELHSASWPACFAAIAWSWRKRRRRRRGEEGGKGWGGGGRAVGGFPVPSRLSSALSCKVQLHAS